MDPHATRAPTGAQGLLPPIPLERSGGVSLQRQLAAGLRALVLDGRLPAGRRLPSTRALAEELELSRNTVLYAYEQLASEGYLVSRRGAGTFVARAMARSSAGLAPGRPARAPRLARRHARLSSEPAADVPPVPPTAFTVGFPDPREFPRATFARLSARTFRDGERALFDYGDARGLLALREAIADYVASSRGVRCTADQVVVVHGSQQALDLIGRVLLDPGARVWLEEPGYSGARAAFRAAGAQVVPTPMDDEGIELDALPADDEPRAIAVTPSNQFPTGVTMSLARRVALLERARRCDAWIVEDDYDSEFRYRGAPIPALQGLDEDGRVLYVGTFSKTLSPALRAGYVVLPPALVEPFARARTVTDQSPSPLLQAVLAEFLREGHYARHLARLRRLYGRRKRFLEQGLAALPHPPRVRAADGGLHLVAELPEGVGEHECWERLRARGIRSVPMSIFRLLPDERAPAALLLGYAGFDEAELTQGLREFAAVLALRD